MTDEFMREERYIVFKVSDVERYLTDKDRANIAMMKMEIAAGRDCANKPPFKGLIVEADWPEYEPTWKAIEARVTGAQPAPSVPEGWKLVPIEPTPMMKTAGIGVEVYQDSPPSSDCLTWEEAEAIYTAMLAAAPEAKPCP